MAANQRGKLVVVSGPSGVGKSTIDRAVIEQTSAEFSVSATTRPPRPGEVDGRDYHFVSRDTFETMIRQDRLLEWAEVFGHFYGTPAEPVQQAIEAGRTVLLEIDVQGGLQVHEKMPDATFVLIVPPSMDELTRRLQQRRTEDDDACRQRLAKARHELQIARQSGAYTNEVINDNLDDAIRDVMAIVVA